MRYNVAGADVKTGDDRVITIEATDQRVAEDLARSEGILVAAVFPAELLSTADQLDSMVGPGPAPNAKRSPPSALPYQTKSAVVVPDYRGLKSASLVLRVTALLAYATGAITMLLAIFNVVANDSYGFRSIWGWTNFLVGMVAAASPIAIAALLHGASAACTALRDIARNSFR